VQITDALNSHTVEDVRRNADGSVTLYCDSGRELTLYVWQGRIEAKPPKIILLDAPEQIILPSTRMRLLDAFQGLRVNHAYYDASSSIVFVCEPCNTGKAMFEKSFGHREIKLTHSLNIIDEFPSVSAIIKLPGQVVSAKRGG
jgi:hypothetical protein